MRYPTLSKEVLKNGETMGPVNINGQGIKFFDTSSYDSVTEILSHAIRRNQRVKNYFECFHDQDNIKYSYATTVLNYAKHGPTGDSYKFRGTFLYKTTIRARRLVLCYLQTPSNILTRCLGKYLDVDSRFRLCWSCRTSQTRSLYISMNEVSGGSIEKIIRKFFVSEVKVCTECVHKTKAPLVDTLPLMSISTEHDPLPVGPAYCEYDGDTEESRASFDVLPVQLTVDGCDYVLCGVIGRVSVDHRNGYHYVAFCRNVDGRWDKRDNFNEEIESLGELPVVYFSQIFYVNVGYWDATERKSLLDPAKSAWYRITEIRLPELCVHEIFGYLDNQLLKLLIKAAEADN